MFQFSPLYRSDPDWFDFVWPQLLVNEWTAGEHVQVGMVRRPHVPTGYYLVCTIAGECGHRHPYVPTLPDQAGETVYDAGGVQWELVLPGDAVTPAVSSVVYTIEPEGVEVVGNTVPAPDRSRVRLDAEYAEPGCYTITALMTDSTGEEHTARAQVRVI